MVESRRALSVQQHITQRHYRTLSNIGIAFCMRGSNAGVGCCMRGSERGDRTSVSISGSLYTRMSSVLGASETSNVTAWSRHTPRQSRISLSKRVETETITRFHAFGSLFVLVLWFHVLDSLTWFHAALPKSSHWTAPTQRGVLSEPWDTKSATSLNQTFHVT